MRLKPLARFKRDHLTEPYPDSATLKRWPGAQKIGGRWYIDMDAWQSKRQSARLAEELIKDPAVARLVS